MANQYPKVSGINRQAAKFAGAKTYISGTPCKKCGSMEKYTSSMGCVSCNVALNKPKLAELMASRPKPAYNTEKRRRALLRQNYGMSPAQYDAMLTEQNGKCAICGADKCTTGRNFAVDHDHTTKKVRGILCCSCNQGLGQFKENPEIMMNAIAYLRKERL